MSAEDASVEPIRKKARTYLTNITSEDHEVSSIKCSPSHAQQRADELSQKLSAFYTENPEMKYVMQYEKLQANVKSAVEKYRIEVEAEANFQLNEKKSPLYTLPDEVLRRCMSYVGGKDYGLVAPASKKICFAYKEEFGGQEASFTSNISAAASLNTAKYCVENLCKTMDEKDDIFIAAAVNGNIDILRYATSSGYDLLAILCWITDSSKMIQYYDDCTFGNIVEEIVANGHLHILQYIHDQIGYQFGCRGFSRPAIKHGKFEILEWLNSINALDEHYLRYDSMRHIITFGRVDVVKWIQSLQQVNGKVFLKPNLDFDINAAIASESIDMIQYSLQMGKEFNDESETKVADTKSLEVFRFCHENGLDYSETSMHKIIINLPYRKESEIYEEFLEIIKFLRSVGVPWPGEDTAGSLFCRGSLEIVQYAYENGLTLTNYNDLIERFLVIGDRNAEKLKFLIANGTSWDTFLSNEIQLNDLYLLQIWELKDLHLLDCFIGKNAQLDERILKSILQPRQKGFSQISPHTIAQIDTKYKPVWLEGVQFMFEKGKDIDIFIEDVVHPYHHPNMILIKFLRTCQGCHWTRNDETRNKLLCRIACSLGIEDVKWAYENGCRGGSLVPFIDEQWDEGHMMRTSEWYSNYNFFAEKGLLDFNIQDIGNDFMYIDSFEALEEKKLISYRLHLDLHLTNFLAKRGYKYSCTSHKKLMIALAFRNCCDDTCDDNRKILALLLSIRTRNQFE